MSSLLKTISGPAYISARYVQSASHVCIKCKVHNFKHLSFISEPQPTWQIDVSVFTVSRHYVQGLAKYWCYPERNLLCDWAYKW